MLNEEFNELVNDRLNIIKKLLMGKGKEYTNGNIDRLRGFKIGAEICGITPELFALVCMVKHLVWLIEAKDEINNPSFFKDFTEDKLDEHIGDIDTYMLLIEALFKERYNKHYNRNNNE